MVETRITHVWRNSQPGKPWLVDEWEEDWPSETFTSGESLPWGPLLSIGTYHNPHSDRPASEVQMFELRLQDLVHGKWNVTMRFADIQRGPTVPKQLTVRGEAGIFYHRWFKEDPIMAKIEIPDGDGNGLIRGYTWWVAEPMIVKRLDSGVWVPA